MVYNKETDVGDILYAGDTQEERRRNRALLADYDYTRYVEGLTGYAGQNLQRIAQVSHAPAVRTRVGGRGHYKAALARRRDGALLCAPCVAKRGEGLYDVEFFITVYASLDRGESWQAISRTQLRGKEPSMAVCPDGTIILTAQPITDGQMGYEMPVYRSMDGGVHWECSYISGNRDYPRNLFVDRDGSVCFMRCAGVRFEFEENVREAGDARIEIYRSHDSGQSFEKSFGVIKDWDYPGFMEISSLRLADGTLLASLRHQPAGTKGEGFENTLLTCSSDNGATWSRPRVVSRTGEVHFAMTSLPDGRLLGTYSNYHLPFGVCAVTSEDGGRTWAYDRIYQLSMSADYYLGWGNTLALDNGELLTAYASTPYLCESPDTTVCETVRWRL